ncbi:kinase-like domain-containing protein [Entophlyctis helioformis]|nr:kinase-like domain-containing protein [Entophlyctis helioformis]
MIEGNKRIYVVMELIEGGNLEQHMILAGGPLPLVELLCNFRKVVDAVVYMHSQGIVHRDIKPPNILFQSPGGQLKVGDFGSAADMNNPLHMLTKFGTTEHWSAPEADAYGDLKSIVDNQAAKLDVYSCGMLLLAMYWGYEKLTGWLYSGTRSGMDTGNNTTNSRASMDADGDHQQPSPAHISFPHASLAAPSLGTPAKQPLLHLDHPAISGLPGQVREIVVQMIEPNPTSRIAIEAVAQIEWVRAIQRCCIETAQGPQHSSSENEVGEKVAHTHLTVSGPPPRPPTRVAHGGHSRQSSSPSLHGIREQDLGKMTGSSEQQLTASVAPLLAGHAVLSGDATTDSPFGSRGSTGLLQSPRESSSNFVLLKPGIAAPDRYGLFHVDLVTKTREAQAKPGNGTSDIEPARKDSFVLGGNSRVATSANGVQGTDGPNGRGSHAAGDQDDQDYTWLKRYYGVEESEKQSSGMTHSAQSSLSVPVQVPSVSAHSPSASSASPSVAAAEQASKPAVASAVASARASTEIAPISRTQTAHRVPRRPVPKLPGVDTTGALAAGASLTPAIESAVLSVDAGSPMITPACSSSSSSSSSSSRQTKSSRSNIRNSNNRHQYPR